MNKRVFIIMIFTILLITGCNNSKMTEEKEGTVWTVESDIHIDIDWVDFIKFNGITYIGSEVNCEEDSNCIMLGELYSKVEFKVSGVNDSGYQAKDGDAAFLNVGTEVYTINGYDPSFRLAIKESNRLRIYEVDSNPKAAVGRDLLGIEEKVKYITLNSKCNEKTVLEKIDDEEVVEAIVNLVMESPIIRGVHPESKRRCFIQFHLDDGTTVTRSYWIDDGIIQRNIKVPEDMKMIIEEYIENGS